CCLLYWCDFLSRSRFLGCCCSFGRCSPFGRRSGWKGLVVNIHILVFVAERDTRRRHFLGWWSTASFRFGLLVWNFLDCLWLVDPVALQIRIPVIWFLLEPSLALGLLELTIVESLLHNLPQLIHVPVEVDNLVVFELKE